MVDHTCCMCQSRKARFLRDVQDRQGSTQEKFFCSYKCAARWALLHVYDETHWCYLKGRWECEPQYECRNHCCGPEDWDPPVKDGRLVSLKEISSRTDYDNETPLGQQLDEGEPTDE